MKRIAVLVGLAATAIGGCASDKPAPSCQQAVTHYYASGCTFVTLSTGQPTPAGEVIGACQSTLSSASTNCLDEFATLRSCWNETITPAKVSADCDCSAEQDAYSSCR